MSGCVCEYGCSMNVGRRVCLCVYTGNMPKNRVLTFYVTGLKSVNVWFKV